MPKKYAFWRGLVAGGAAFTAYWSLFRPWMNRWGATDVETSLCLPGDELVPQPRLNVTHAITIQASAAEIWPWLVQIGQGRGGFYSYTWIEKVIGLDIQNAGRILPEYQGLQAGELIPFSPRGDCIPAVIVEPLHALVLHTDTRDPEYQFALKVPPGEFFQINWGFYLEPVGLTLTRLIERWRVDWSPVIHNELFMHLVMEPGGFLMGQKMLKEIKRLAENFARNTNPLHEITL